MERQFAILAYDCDDVQTLQTLISTLMANAVCSQINVFTKEQISNINTSNEHTTCTNIIFPAECNTITKARNYINQQYKQIKFNGFLHVLNWTTILLKDPTDFLHKLEDMMDKLDYNVWFNTICDPCNYIYHKYCPRTYIALDDEQYDKLATKHIAITSHSNTQWIAYNFAKATDSNLYFDEDFTISMFYIIEFLARRKAEATDKQLYFMNEYFTVEEEKGIFESIKKDEKIDQEIMKKEDALFATKNIKHNPDNNIDLVASRFYLKLKSI